jgi:surface polysaccharide O-acyltransferase-like enzyme
VSQRPIASVEGGRVLAVLAVLAIHTLPLAHLGGPPQVGSSWSAGTIVNQLARFAVPCFFVLSGFFWGRRTTDPTRLLPVSRDMVRRLLRLFAVWSAIFILPFQSDQLLRDFPHGASAALASNWGWIVTHPAKVALQGTNGHLWFLMSLAMVVSISAAWLRVWRVTPLLLFALLLFALALCAVPYKGTPLGLSLPFNARQGPAFGLLFFVLGVALSRHAPQPRWGMFGGVLMGVGVIASVAELTWLRVHLRTTLAQDFVLGTVPYGVGAALVALSGHPWLSWPPLVRLGPLVLGIYAVHPIFVELLEPMARRLASPWWDLGYLLLVFAASWGTTTMLQRVRWGRWFVR